ncbi:putative 5-Methylcytosine G/T mismatch-specific DNA glycosylase [Diplocarpon rosae]|nr:putative 5-Methylcytosine G/T mismatch-specific DNA glycosylase [Diplocarpon rosae]
MGHKEEGNNVEERPSERRHRSKSERDPNRPRKTRPKVIDPETGEVVKSSHRRRKDKDSEKGSERGSEPSSSMADLVPELSRTASTPGATSRSSLPYPSFNKTYSKEAVNSRDDVRLPAAKKTSPYTPESTDLGSDGKGRTKSSEHIASPQPGNTSKGGRPPTPPETEFSQPRKSSSSRMSKVQEDVEEECRPSSSTSWFGKMAGKEQIKETTTRSKVSTKSKSSKASTAIKTPRQNGASADHLRVRDSGIGSGLDSNITSVAPKRDQEKRDSGGSSKRPPVLDTDSSPDSAHDSSPQTPTQTPQFSPPAAASIKPAPAPFIHLEGQDAAVSSAYESPQPPPPPPPPNVPINVPRVDYLMQNGGLPRPVPKTLLSAGPPLHTQHSGSKEATPVPPEIEKIFGPFYGILDQYEAVINKNGSMAVATGYRSVARRLLDRLENVFNRDLSSEGCFCVMCQHPDLAAHEGSRGLGWGEVLEWVSGRRELPVWPAFDFATLGVRAGEDLSSGLGISGEGGPGRPRSPVKMDPDIDEQFREHYLQQTKKTKHAVDKWLSSCPQTAATPPQEVDDETLSFAILTHLDQRDRPIFNALVSGSTVLQPVSRAPQSKPRSEFMVKTVHSIQRLYRLQSPPRDPEAAIYLLKHPNLHNLLATMSSINSSEWEILTSGRFDGFLWSGADDSTTPQSRGPTPSNGIPFRSPASPATRHANPSRTNTPFSAMRNQTFSPSIGGLQSRGPTPSSQLRQPVSNDEETEIAVLAEVEREIYLSMEALEDAFEGLHRKAELVRRALRERGAGLSISLQSRQPAPDIMSAGTPGFPPAGLGPGYERQNWGEGSENLSESDWEPESELMSELAPDDSASNISSSRHRRPKRRNERRTPALVEEEEEE